MQAFSLLKGFFLIALLFLFSCKGADSGFAPSAESAAPVVITAVVISPASITVAVSNAQLFTASGGVAPYSYSIFTGSGSVSLTTGVFTAPGTAGLTTVRVTDASGQTSDAIITVNPALQISPAESVTRTVAVPFVADAVKSPVVAFIDPVPVTIEKVYGVTPLAPVKEIVEFTKTV